MEAQFNPNFLAQTLQSINGYDLFADLPGFRTPSIITGDRFRPDLLLTSSNNSLLYIVELIPSVMSQTLSQTSDERTLNIRNLSNSNETLLTMLNL